MKTTNITCQVYDILTRHRYTDDFGEVLGRTVAQDLVDFIKEYGEAKYKEGYKDGCEDSDPKPWTR